MNQYVELLSGAGDMESARAAISAGCDAIYLGTKNFGARRMAENFTPAGLGEITKLAHAHGKKIYLTVNTLVKDSEIEEFIKSVYAAINSGIDALIMQDAGMIKLARETFPGVDIHASTQMNIHSVAAVTAVQKLGVKRVILSRECELAEIEEICKGASLEVETFVFGALCSAVSGVCYMSSFNNNRSGNRGVCTQMCRLKYSGRDGIDKFYLSTRDYCALSLLKKLFEAGVTSFKIEGRNRSAAYVYNVTSVFREAIDLIYARKYDQSAINRLTEKASMTYNRGLSGGYLVSRRDAGVIFSERNANNGLLISDEITSFSPESKSVRVSLKHGFNKNDLLELESDSFERFAIKPEAILSKFSKPIFEAKVYDSVNIVYKPTGGEDSKIDLSKFVPKRMYLTFSQQASSIKAIKGDGVNPASLPADPSKTPIKIDVKIDTASISCVVKCLGKEFNYSLSAIEVMKAEKRPLTAETVENTFLCYDKNKFYLKPSDLKCFLADSIFIPLSRLKGYGRDIFEKFLCDFTEFESGRFDKILKSLEIDKSVPVSLITPDPANFDVKLMLFDEYGISPEKELNNYNGLSFHYYFLSWLYKNNRLEKFLTDNGEALKKCDIELPPVIFESQAKFLAAVVDFALKGGFRGVIINNFAQLEIFKTDRRFKNSPAKLIAGTALNVINRYSSAYLRDAGFDEYCLSFELNDGDIVEYLEALSRFEPELARKVRIRLYGNLNVANFAYDFFEQNKNYVKTRFAGSHERQYMLEKLSFKNGHHYIVGIDAETTMAYSGGLLNMAAYIQKYASYRINKFDISLFNYSDHFKQDLLEAGEFISNIRESKFAQGGLAGRGVTKDRVLL